MQIISCCTILFILILNILCTGQENKDWKIFFSSPEVTVVPGLCALISCNFTYPDDAKPINNVLWNLCNKSGQCTKEIFNFTEVRGKTGEKKEAESPHVKMLEPDLTKNNCSIIVKNIKAEDKKVYLFRVEGSGQNTYNLTVKITIQDKPIMAVPPLIEGQEASLTCSAPFPCPETPPNITWWTRVENITDLKNNNITLTTSESLYLSTFTLTPTSDLHNATVGCDVSYGSKTISTSSTLNIMRDTKESKVNESFSPGSENKPLNDTRNTTGIDDFFKNLDISKILTFVAGMVCSALIFSVVLCCWVSCHRGKKHKVPTANPDTEVNLEMVQTDVAQTGTNEETPLHEQLNGGNPNMAGPSDGAEEDEAVDAKEVDYASIDYSLLKDKPPEEREKEPTDTDYAEIKRDKRGDGKERNVLQDGDDQIETPDQMEGEEELYSNSQELKR